MNRLYLCQIKCMCVCETYTFNSITLESFKDILKIVLFAYLENVFINPFIDIRASYIYKKKYTYIYINMCRMFVLRRMPAVDATAPPVFLS